MPQRKMYGVRYICGCAPQNLASHPLSEAFRDLKTKIDVLAACRSGAPRIDCWHTMWPPHACLLTALQLPVSLAALALQHFACRCA